MVEEDYVIKKLELIEDREGPCLLLSLVSKAKPILPLLVLPFHHSLLAIHACKCPLFSFSLLFFFPSPVSRFLFSLSLTLTIKKRMYNEAKCNQCLRDTIGL